MIGNIFIASIFNISYSVIIAGKFHLNCMLTRLKRCLSQFRGEEMLLLEAEVAVVVVHLQHLLLQFALLN